MEELDCDNILKHVDCVSQLELYQKLTGIKIKLI